MRSKARFRTVALGWCLGMAAAGAAPAQTPGTGSVTGTVIDRDTGQPLKFANVVVLGTQWGGYARDGGAFTIANVPVGTYSVKASFVGYDPQILAGVQFDAGKPTPIQFKLNTGRGTVLETVRVVGRLKTDVRGTEVSHVQTEQQFLSLPVESVAEALTLRPAVVGVWMAAI